MQHNLKTLNSLVHAHYSTNAFSTTRLNRAATARATAHAGASGDAAKVYNKVVQAKGTPVGRAISLQNRIGVALRKLGLHCQIGGIYLPVKRIQEAQNIFDDGIAELDVIREDILFQYPEMEAKVRAKLADFAHEVEIPSATVVASSFQMRLTILNRPVAVGEMEGVVDEVANRIRAESQRREHELLRAAHAGPVDDLRKQLAEFVKAMRENERLHLSQFDKLRDEARRVASLNVLDLPEVDEVIRLAAAAASMPSTSLTYGERDTCARKAEVAMTKADETLAALGL